MDIYNGLDFTLKDSAVSLGKFDGIHQGHRLLLAEVMKRRSLHPTVFTFGASQGNGVMPSQQIYSPEEKQILLEEIGIEREIIFPFNEHSKNMPADEFIDDVLVHRMDAKFICVGSDFHFGQKRQGDAKLLQKMAEKYGYELLVMPKRMQDEEVISSTRIRWELSTGRLEQVNELLGRPYMIYGEVVHGNALGRTMGMPTANIMPLASKVLPVYGVYATTVYVDGMAYAGVTNIGLKPTVGAENTSVETTLLHFNENLYGKKILVQFHHFLRREKKFESLEALTEQMERDKAKADQLIQI